MAALRAARGGRSVVVLERAPAVGGMAGSFEVAGMRVDFGSHRLHPVIAPRLRATLDGLLGDDLQTRSRHGRISFQGEWLAFPLRFTDVSRNMPRATLARIAVDTLAAPLRRSDGVTAADVISARLGPTIARTFYIPYLTKLWDTSPHELSAELADRRVSARSGMAVVRKALRRGARGGDRFLYPRQGFGQISEAIAGAATEAGARVCVGTAITGLRLDDDAVQVVTADGAVTPAATALSTLPVAQIARLAGAPPDVVSAGDRLQHRSMVLAYLVLATDRFTEYDAHYFPSLDTPASRLSEAKNYRAGDDPAGTTVLYAELPCWEGDATWTASAEELGRLVADSLTPLGLDFRPLIATDVRQIRRCYPVYSGSYVDDLATVEAWVSAQARLLTLGRQGLFVADNTHHTLTMGWEAADALRPDGTVDRARWSSSRASFRTNVVED